MKRWRLRKDDIRDTVLLGLAAYVVVKDAQHPNNGLLWLALGLIGYPVVDRGRTLFGSSGTGPSSSEEPPSEEPPSE